MGKNKPNAYSLFVRDSFNRLQREGKNPNWQSLFSELNETWRGMSDAEKQKYKDRAKNPQQGCSKDRPPPGSHSNPVSSVLSDSKPSCSSASEPNSQSETKPKTDFKPIIADLVSVGGTVAIKRSHDEIDWDDDDEEENQLTRDEKKIRLGIPNHWQARKDKVERYQDIHLVKIRETCKAIIAARANNFISMPVYGFSVNVLCFKRIDNVGIYVPIEIGICAYSLKAGRLGEPYHALIDAGPPLEGCINHAADHARDTHKITIPSNGDSYPAAARKDYRKIYREIIEYTKAGERTILVWDAREMQQVIGSLEWLYEKANQQMGPGKLPKVSTWTVLPVMEFTANMSNFVHMNMLGNQEPVFIIHYYINMLLEAVNIHDYEKELMCDYHQGVETKWCARNCAIRMLLSIERVFEEIYKGFMITTNPEFLRYRMMKTQPLLYHQHRASQQFLSARANAASSNGEQIPQIKSNQQTEQQQVPVLAILAPEQSPATIELNNPVGMVIEDELPNEPGVSSSTASELNPTLRDPRIRV